MTREKLIQIAECWYVRGPYRASRQAVFRDLRAPGSKKGHHGTLVMLKEDLGANRPKEPGSTFLHLLLQPKKSIGNPWVELLVL